MRVYLFLFIPIFPTALILPSAVLSSQLNASRNLTHFSREYLGVLFQPESDDATSVDLYRVDELVAMVSKISSQFGTVLMRPLSPERDTYQDADALEIPIAVATYNKHRRRQGPDHQQPVQLIMQSYAADTKGVDARASFDLVIELANRANSIFPATVRILLLDVVAPKINSGSVNDTIHLLQYAQSKINANDNNNNEPSSNFKYTLGAHFTSGCLSSKSKWSPRLDPHLHPILPHLQYIMFWEIPELEAFRFGNSLVVKKFTEQLDKCKGELVKLISPSTVVAFASGWSPLGSIATTAKDAFREPSDQLTFWKGMNEWAERTKTSVILSEAFDGPNDEFPSGWWKLIENASYRDATDYVYETKEEINLKDTTFSVEHFAVWFDPYVSKRDGFGGDRYNLEELVSMVAKISSKFKLIIMPVLPTESANDYWEIPIAVATFNKIHNRLDGTHPPPPPPLRLIMQFKDLGFKQVKDVADEANRIYPGTVQIILLYPDKLDDNLKTDLQVSAERNNNNNGSGGFRYQLGASVPFLACGYKSKLDSSLLPALPLVQHLVLWDMPSPGQLNSGVDEFLRQTTERFKKCEKKVRGHNPGIKLWFLSCWPDTFNESASSSSSVRTTTSLSSVVNFWHGMNRWAAGSSKTGVILHDAFDDPYKIPPWNSVGWWRLVENGRPPYRSAKDYKFEEKEQVVYDEARSIVPFLTTSSTPGTNFSREYVGVSFSPYVKEEVYSEYLTNFHSVQEIVILVSKVYSQFNRIMLEPIDDEVEKYDDLFDVPSAVAIFNKDYRPSEQPPMTLVVQFKLDISQTVGKSQTRSFEIAKGMADEANLVFPGTIQLLLLQTELAGNDEDDALVSLISEQLQAARSEINNNKFPYQLGISLPLNDCLEFTSAIHKMTTKTRVPLRYMEFRASPSKEDLDRGMDSLTVRGVIANFESCKKQIAKFDGPEVEVGFNAEWPDDAGSGGGGGGDSGHKKIADLVYFWQGIADWAARSGTKVMLNEAFDNPFRSPPPRKTLGWWRLIPSRSYRHAGNYVFETKEDVLVGGRERRIDLGDSADTSIGTTTTVVVRDDEASGFSGTSITFLILGPAVLVLILFGAGGLYWHKRVVNQRVHNLLSKADIQSFFEGESSTIPLFDHNNPATSGMVELAYAYDQSLEVSSGSYEIDGHVLGSGAFGLVFKGKIITRNTEVGVAVKTTKDGCPAYALKGLLSEIKIMSHIGKHEHIVSIVGAHTEQLHQGKVFVFTEYCALGSLDKFLQGIQRPQFQVSYVNTAAAAHSTNASYVNTGSFGKARLDRAEMDRINLDLQKWTYEIASGMEYLASKHVVHADLATRNILLTELNKTAKISDFGLSRRLYDYENYVKSQQEPLPWRWLSPESLSRMVFNEKTDVWSFGITLWEIFSLGDVPYPGMSWDVDWVSRLENGLRLGKPKYDTKGRFTIMLQCWDATPHSRPSFSELKASLAVPIEGEDDACAFPQIEYLELN